MDKAKFDPTDPTQIPDGESFMSIGGVDVRDMQAAYRALPELQRWMQTSTKLIGDLYELMESGSAINNSLEARCKDLEAQLAEHEKEGKDDDVS